MAVFDVIGTAAIYVGLLSFCQQHVSAASYALVTATEGHIVGEKVQESAIFRGVPFSRPPVGEWRWRRPRSPTPYERSYWNATYSRPGCAQICETLRKKYCCAPVTSEDCLYLNVWVPHRLLEKSKSNSVFGEDHYVVRRKYRSGNSDSLAVMFYIHGGGFHIGAGSALLYDSRYLANRGDVVVVTTNYRLGVMGFLAQADDNSVNFGIFDQIRALKWIKKNIANFGGNPNKVTIFGQSAGAESIAIMMASPHGAGLFQQAIIQSEPWSVPYRTLPEAKRFGDKLAKTVGCEPRNMTCLRSISTSKLLKAGEKLGHFNLQSSGKVLYAFQMWGPVIDGDLLPRLPLYSFLEGKYHRMPVIIGNDRNEGYVFIFTAFKKSVGMLKYVMMLAFLGGDKGNSMMQKYPACMFCDNREILSKLATDYAFICPTRRVLLETGKDSWGYLFDASVPFKGVYKNDVCTKKVCHGSELPYIFDTVPLTNFTFNAREQNLAHEVQRYWTNFAKYGDPNGKGIKGGSPHKHWKRFLNKIDGSYGLMRMRKEGNSMLHDPYSSTCQYWDGLNSYGKF